MSRLKAIKLESFKGASTTIDLEFRTDNKLALIYGENGTGKSTLADAFDFVCNESIGSLEDKSVEQPAGKFLTNINSQPENCKVTLTYNNSEWIATLGLRSKPTVRGAFPRPDARILRRDKILDFITKPPRDRYDAVKVFIETPNCERMEKLVNDLKVSYNEQYERAVEAAANSTDALNLLWEKENSPLGNALDWAFAQLVDDVEALNVSLKACNSLISDLNSILKFRTEIETVRKNISFTNSLKEIKKAELVQLLVSQETNITDLLKVLEDAKLYFENSQLQEICPVCEQPIIQAELQRRINDRLSSMNEFSVLQKELERLEKLIETYKQQELTLGYSVLDKTISLAIKVKESTLTELSSLGINWESYAQILSVENKTSETLFDLADTFYVLISKIKPSLENKSVELGKQYAIQNSISSHLQTINDKNTHAKKMERMLLQTTLLLNLIIEQRKRFVQETLNQITDDIDTMYSKIHPSENIGNVRLVPDPVRRGSLDLLAKFENKDETQPQAYYSESHLDTLGICLFIALSKFFKTENTILILDDVITSADQVHLSRFMLMLEEQLPNFQHTIITTHYNVWRNKFRYSGGNVQLIELLPWSIGRGIQHTKTKLYLEEIQHHFNVEPFDKQIVASKAGIFLELLLDRLALLYRCKLPRKPEPFFTLGEFLNAFDSGLKRRMKVEVVDSNIVISTINLLEYFNVLPEASMLRNEVGCHFNNVGENYTQQDIQDFAESTINFGEAILCNSCGESPTKSNSGSFYECRCGKKRLYPLEN